MQLRDVGPAKARGLELRPDRFDRVLERSERGGVWADG
jgi:hypothetical protein